MQFAVLWAILLAVAAVSFAVQNTDLVAVSFFKWTFQGSLALILLVTFLCGFLASLLFSIPSFLKYRLQISAERHRAKQLESQIPPKQNPPTSKKEA
jgi:uncharacterized integral membrane protein